MPYIITTHTRKDAIERSVGLAPRPSRRAVATLEEARDVAEDAVIGEGRFDNDEAFLAAIVALPESGGTIGPLPDGTVIEVTPFKPNVPAWRAAEIVDAYADGTARHPFYCGECEATHQRSEDCRA